MRPVVPLDHWGEPVKATPRQSLFDRYRRQHPSERNDYDMWITLTNEQVLKVAARITAVTSTGHRHQSPDEYVAAMLIAAMTPGLDGEPFGDVVAGPDGRVVADPWVHR